MLNATEDQMATKQEIIDYITTEIDVHVDREAQMNSIIG